MLKWVKSFRAMSSLRKGGPPPRMKKKNSDVGVISNGSGNNTLYYRNDPPDDENMNEIADENVDLTVLLPGGLEKDISVNSNIPMMDLLVNLAARNKLSPAGYTIVVLNQDTNKPMDYKPNQTVGSLCPKTVDGAPRQLTVQLVPKKGDAEKQRNSKNAQPFEMTKRFTVNLPQNQKKVLRISPATPLEDVHRQICSEKSFDPFRYKFQLSSDPYQNISMQMTVGELKSQEINMVVIGTVNSAMSMPNLASDRSQSTTNYMPSAGETKKKKGFFSFLKKDNSKKFSVQNVRRDPYVEHQAGTRGAPVRSTSQDNSPVPRNIEGNPGARPKTMYAQSTTQLDKISDAKMSVPRLDLSGINSQNINSKSKSLTALKVESEKPVVAPARKKRRAPAPPQAQSVQNTVQVEVSIEKPKQNVKSKVETTDVRQRTENVSTKFHSRNSSDSSGYHELTLSGAESPEGARIDEHFEGIDTASWDSGGHLNGDSGIQNISPPASRRREIEGETGYCQTLPLERTKKNSVPSSSPRSSSLDRTGKKKKAAPPPPGQPPPPPISKSITAPAAKKKDEEAAINDVLANLDQNLEELDVSGEAIMVENTSLRSEDLDQDQLTHPPRPCAFVAPPPPTEPPPDDSEPIDYNMIMSGRVDTVDVGVETSDDSTSYGPVSTRSSSESPVSMHSRAESRTSISSVNTVDDVSLDFERTIAVCEEEVMRAEQETPEYKNEMAQFVEKMKEMTVDADRFKNKNDAEVEEINSEMKTDDAVYIFPQDGVNDSVEMENVPENYSEPKWNESDATDSGMLSHSNREVSEITYDFKINAVPPEFQSEIVAPIEVTDKNYVKGDVTQSDEEEEEEVITETIEIVPFSGQVMTEPDEEEVVTTTEIIEIPMSVKEEIVLSEREPVVEKIPDVEPVSQIKVEEKIQPKEPEKPKEKEEFVLTFDDLNKVDFSLMRKKPKMQPKSRPPFQSTPEKRHTVSTLEEIKSNFGVSNEDGFVTPTKEHTVTTDDGSMISEHGSVRGHRGEVKTKCSELGFSPSSEGEVEHVFETKSISMLNLPAFRASSGSVELNNEVKDSVKVSKTEIVFTMNSSVNKLDNDSMNRTSSTSSNLENSTVEETSYRKASVNDSGVEADSSPIDPQEALSAQHKQLQEQCSMWQVQLEQNKKLLASTQAIPADDTSRQLQQQLQSQIQMQQQMLQTMQDSMEALNVQPQLKTMESKVSNLQKEEVFVEQTTTKTETKPANVPPPPALPNGKLTNNLQLLNRGPTTTEQTKPKSKGKSKKFIEPKLDPREELMIAIRNFGGRSAMKKVPVNKTHWHSGIP